MSDYKVTITPQTSLFLGCDRGNRVIRKSFQFIPASTISGAINTWLYQRGMNRFMCSFRVGNIYPVDDNNTIDPESQQYTWIPAPQNLYYCPSCGNGFFLHKFSPEDFFSRIICISADCKALCKRYKGYVKARVSSDQTIISLQDSNTMRRTIQEVNSRTIGRTAHSRITQTKAEGLFYGVNILRVKGKPFSGILRAKGQSWFEHLSMEPLSLTIGGQTSRGSGRVRMTLILEEENGITEEKVSQKSESVLVETPLLPWPENLHSIEPVQIDADVFMPFVTIGCCERWATKPMSAGKGLCLFDNVIDRGSVVFFNNDKIHTTYNLSDCMFFYQFMGDKIILCYLTEDVCSQLEQPVDQGYSFKELWSLGFGRLSYLLEEKLVYDKE